VKTIALRLSRNARFLSIALTLMFASYAVYRLRAVSYAVPTSLETAGTDRTDYDAGDTVFVRGSGYEPSTAVRVCVTRPDGSVATEVASIDGAGNLAFAYLPEVLTGRFTVQVLGRDDVRLAVVEFRRGPVLGTDEGNYRAGETVAFRGSR